MEFPAELWTLISLIIKVVVYVSYFFPMLGARVLDYVDLWPTWWPFSPII